MEDLFTSVKETLIDRLSSPLLGAFLVSWPLWNYKFVVILFSQASVSTTFHMIDSIAFPNATKFLLFGIIYPLASALSYVFIYPYPAKFIYGFARRRQSELAQIKIEIENGYPLSKEESIKLRTDHRAEMSNYKKLIDELMNELELAKKSPASDPAPEIETTPPPQVDKLELSTLEMRVMTSIANLLEKRINKATDTNISSMMRTSLLQTQYVLDKLTEKKLVHPGLAGYSLTTYGRRVLMEHTQHQPTSDAD